MWESRGISKECGKGGNRFTAFHAFHTLFISIACFSRGKCGINRYAATQCKVPHSPRDAHGYSSLVNECIGDYALFEIHRHLNFRIAGDRPGIQSSHD